MCDWHRFSGIKQKPEWMVLLKGNAVKTSLVYADSEILEKIAGSHPALIAVDPSLSLPEKGESFRKADREMIGKGYRVFPPNLPAMKKPPYG